MQQIKLKIIMVLKEIEIINNEQKNKKNIVYQ